MSRNSKKVNVLLWIAQALLAALFAFAGAMKFILPVAVLQQGPVVLPLAFIYFIGVAELLGAFGLVLPGIFRVHRYLTPLAALGLVIIVAGATVISAVGGVATAIVPCVTGIVAYAVFHGRGGLSVVTRGPVGSKTELVNTY